MVKQTILFLILIIQLISASEFDFEITDQKSYADKLAELDHKLMAIRQIRAYSRRYQVGEQRSDPMKHVQMEEIVKAHSKAVEEANDMVVNILSHDKRAKQVRKGDKKAVAQIQQPPANMMNYIIEQNRLYFDRTLESVQKLITGFSCGGASGLFLFMSTPKRANGTDSLAELWVSKGNIGDVAHQLPLETSFDEEKDHAYFSSQPLGGMQSSFINGVIYTSSDHMLYSYKLSIVNGTVPELSLIAKKELADHIDVQQVSVIKQRGGTKVLVFDRASQNITFYSANLSKAEKISHIPAGPDGSGVKEIVVQPLSLLLMHDDSIDFYKLSSNQLQPRNGSCIASEGQSLQQVVFSPQSAGTLITVSADNSIVVFEAKGKQGQFKCLPRGVMQAPQGLEIQKIKLNTQANVLYVTFKNSNQFSMISYDPKRIFRSMQEQGFFIISLTDDPVLDIHTNQHNIIIEHDKASSAIQYSVFENTNNAKSSNPSSSSSATDSASSGSSGSSKNSSSWSFSSLQYLLVPGIVACVMIYQLFIKEDAPKTKQQQDPRQGRKGLNSQFQKQQTDLKDNVNSQMGDINSEVSKMRDQLAGLGNMGGLHGEVGKMKDQLSSLTSGAEGMTKQMQQEMDSMRKELSGLTANLHDQLGGLGDISKLKELAEKKAAQRGGPQRRANPRQASDE